MYKTLSTKRWAIGIEVAIMLLAGIGLLFGFVFFAMQIGLFNVRGSISERNKFFTSVEKQEAIQIEKALTNAVNQAVQETRKQVLPQIDFSWTSSAEWNTLRVALQKDADAIRKAAGDAGVSPRVLVSVVIAEQLRFFTSDRESFKQFFEPLKILGTLSQFSLGVSGVKPETAEQVEKNLSTPTSPYFVSDERIQNILQLTKTEQERYGSTDVSLARFDRLTDPKDHYYSYLYTALFVRQVSEQWKKAGFDISDRPEILATLFNLGFDKSVPKANPKAAGSTITIDGKTYTFGELAFAFYYSGELLSVFGY